MKYIIEIEVPVCLNLGLCYNKLEKYHHTIKYCSQALDKDEDNDKALYRRGYAYLQVGELVRAKQDL
jgi:tetratricopeptide (TPR) repeat protein